MDKKFYITTAIVYANATPHVGFAYEVIGADVLARYKRLTGYDVFFLTGSDEHSLNVEKKAQELKLTPLEYCDRMISVYKNLWKELNISNDFFIRTSDKVHKECASKIVVNVFNNADVYKGQYEGWYCVSCEAFLNKSDLKDGKCPVHNKEPQLLKEENYFFKLSKYRDKILSHVESNPDFIQPEERKNEILNILKSGLIDVSISRSTFKWGIPFPLEQSSVIYVWFDALINYISAIGYLSDDVKFNKYWPADVHIVGKDITRFHCIIWPAILLALGLPLPRKVFGHGFLNIGGEKISKTKGNIIDPLELSGKYGVDTLRYFLMREVPFGPDGDFSEEALKRRRDADLANDLGNLVMRVLTMVEKYSDGIVPKPSSDSEDINLKKKAEEVFSGLDGYFNKLKFSEALVSIWEFVRLINQHVDKEAPWNLAKDINKKERLKTLLYNLVESLRIISVFISPFMPATSGNILMQIGLDKNILQNGLAKLSAWGSIQPGIKVCKASSLFPKDGVRSCRKP